MRSLPLSVVLLTFAVTAQAGWTQEPVRAVPGPQAATSEAGATAAAPPPVDVESVAKALRDQGATGFVPGNIRVVAEAGPKAMAALNKLRAHTSGRAYLVLCARGTELAPLQAAFAQRLGLVGRDVLVLSTAAVWSVYAPAAPADVLAQLETKAADPRGGRAFDRLEALLAALPAAMQPGAIAELPRPASPVQTSAPAATTADDKTLLLVGGAALGALVALAAVAIGFLLGRRTPK